MPPEGAAFCLGAARLGAERAAAAFGVEALHFVPQKGDDPEAQSALIAQALALGGSVADAVKRNKAETDKWSAVIDAANIKLD